MVNFSWIPFLMYWTSHQGVSLSCFSFIKNWSHISEKWKIFCYFIWFVSSPCSKSHSAIDSLESSHSIPRHEYNKIVSNLLSDDKIKEILTRERETINPRKSINSIPLNIQTSTRRPGQTIWISKGKKFSVPNGSRWSRLHSSWLYILWYPLPFDKRIS